MRLTYQYRLRPNKAQVALLECWYDLLRRQYNYRLHERFSWWDDNRNPINACPLNTPIPQLRDQPDYYSQQNDLINTKELFPEYKQIHSQVLQDCVKRVNLACERWLKADQSGKRLGRPRFKGKGRYRSFTYPQMKQNCIEDRKINLPKIGKVKIILHRPIPEGFKIKTATVIRKADGYYVSLSLEDKTIPDFTSDVNPTLDNTLGIDMGLKSFLVTSDGEEIDIPKYYRKSERRLRTLQKRLSRRQKGSKRRGKAVSAVAKQHKKVADKRRDFHHKTANKLVEKAEVIAHEKLNIKGLARTRMSKSINDAGWGQFLTILAFKAGKAGQLTVAVNPNGTTIECSECGERVPKTLSQRVHICPNCKTVLGRDENAARNVKYRAVGHSVLKSSLNVRELSGSRREAPTKPRSG
jgi:putative transposase